MLLCFHNYISYFLSLDRLHKFSVLIIGESFSSVNNFHVDKLFLISSFGKSIFRARTQNLHNSLQREEGLN